MGKRSPSACIELKEGTHIAKVVLMPGDPLRAKYIAEHYLENPVLFNIYELFNFFDVDAIIRVGSAGALQDSVHVRDVVIAMSASTNSNNVNAYDLPGVIAPTADYEMLRNAVAAAEEIGVRADVGSVYTTDFFYHPDKHVNEKARDLGMLAVEMETAGIYLTAMQCHKKALSILTISDHIFNGEFLSPEEIREGFHEMMEIALKTAVRSNI